MDQNNSTQSIGKNECVHASQVSSTSNSESVTRSLDNKEQEADLNPWQKWLLKKTLESVEKHKKEKSNHAFKKDTNTTGNIKMHKENAPHRLSLESKDRVKEPSSKAFNDWLECKRKAMHQQKALEENMLEQEKLHKQQKQQNIQRLSAEKYAIWKEQKESKLREQKITSELKQQNELEVRMKKKQQSQEAFDKWLHEKLTNNSCKSVHYSYAHYGNDLVCYHDGFSKSKPTFCNPNPWINPLEPVHNGLQLEDPTFLHVCQLEARRRRNCSSHSGTNSQKTKHAELNH